jgi:hypothetical protein
MIYGETRRAPAPPDASSQPAWEMQTNTHRRANKQHSVSPAQPTAQTDPCPAKNKNKNKNKKLNDKQATEKDT